MKYAPRPGVRQQVGVDEAARLLRQREVNAEDVGTRDDARPRRSTTSMPNSLPRPRRAAASSSLKRRLQTSDRHAERARAPRDFLADVAEAEQAERLAQQAARLRELLLVPRARAQLGDVVGDAPVERQDQPQRQLGDGDRVLARAVRHVDAAPRRAGHVDGVDAGAGAHDQRQRARVEHRLGDLRRAHDQHRRAGFGDGRDQRVAAERRAGRSPRSRRPSGHRGPDCSNLSATRTSCAAEVTPRRED